MNGSRKSLTPSQDGGGAPAPQPAPLHHQSGWLLGRSRRRRATTPKLKRLARRVTRIVYECHTSLPCVAGTLASQTGSGIIVVCMILCKWAPLAIHTCKYRSCALGECRDPPDPPPEIPTIHYIDMGGSQHSPYKVYHKSNGSISFNIVLVGVYTVCCQRYR